MGTKVNVKTQIVMFLILFLTSSFTITNDIISSKLTIALWIITSIYLLFSFNKIVANTVVFFCVLSLAFFISSVKNSENTRIMISNMFAFMTVFLFACAFDFEEFKEAFIKIMKFLSIISLVCFSIFSLIESLKGLFVVTNVVGRTFSNLFLYAHSHSVNRNQGMFWEPGAYQSFVNIALLFEITKKDINIKTVIIFVLTIITTFSTTGYLGMALILLLLFLNNDKRKRKQKSVIVCIAIIILIWVYFNQDILFNTNSSSVFGKIIGFFKKEQYNATQGSNSATVRFFAIIKPMEKFFERPLWGWGYQGLIDQISQYTKGMNTCTFVNWFAVYGVLFGLCMLTGFISISRKIQKKTNAFLLVFLILFVVTMSENYVNNAFFILLALYGFNEAFSEGGKNEHCTDQ